jgi:hypothetical protein
VLVLVEEQTNDDLEEENIDIDMDDNNVSDSEHAFNSSPTEPGNVVAEPVFNEAACLLNILI